MPSAPFKRVLRAFTARRGKLSLSVDLKGTQAILRAKTPAFASEKKKRVRQPCVSGYADTLMYFIFTLHSLNVKMFSREYSTTT